MKTCKEFWWQETKEPLHRFQEDGGFDFLENIFFPAAHRKQVLCLIQFYVIYLC